MATGIRIGPTLLDLKQGDITAEQADAIVNAANEGLRGGGGVDGAIHRAGGPAILEACRRIGHCPTGDAVATAAGALAARIVVHTVGPVWRGGRTGEAEQLGSCYRRSLEVAREYDGATVAFPSISTGVYGYPVEAAAPVALGAVREALRADDAFERIRFVLFDDATFRAYADALDRLDLA